MQTPSVQSSVALEMQKDIVLDQISTEVDPKKIKLKKLKHEQKLKKKNNLTLKATNSSAIMRVITKIMHFMRFLPTLLGLVDEFTDFYYYFNEEFHSKILRHICLASLCLSPFILAMLWLTLFIKMNYTGNLSKKMKAKFKLTKSKIYMFLMYFSVVLEILYLAIKYSFGAIMYSVMSEIKVLPIYFTYMQQKKTKYLVTEKILNQYIEKRPGILEHQNHNQIIAERNISIAQFNKEADEYNNANAKKIMYYGLERKNKIDEIPIEKDMKITDTSDIKHLNSLIFDNNPPFFDRIINDTTIKNLLKTTDLIESTFESLPMLILQLINNYYLGAWSNIAIFSMALSGSMTLINAIEIGLSVFKQNILPQIQFYKSVEEEKNNRSQQIEWIFGKVPERMVFYNEEGYLGISKMSHFQLEKIKTIIFDFRSNSNLVKVLSQQLYAIFELIPLKLKKVHSLQLILGQNNKINDDHCIAVSRGLQQSLMSDFRFNIDYSDTISQNGVVPIMEQIQNMPNLLRFSMDISNTPAITDSGAIFTKLMNSLKTSYQIQYIDINFSGKQCLTQESFDSIHLLENCTQLKTLKIDMNGCNQLNDISELKCLNIMKNMKHLNLNFYWCSEITDIQCLENIGQLINLKDLSLNFDQINVHKLKIQNYILTIAMALMMLVIGHIQGIFAGQKNQNCIFLDAQVLQLQKAQVFYRKCSNQSLFRQIYIGVMVLLQSNPQVTQNIADAYKIYNYNQVDVEKCRIFIIWVQQENVQQKIWIQIQKIILLQIQKLCKDLFKCFLQIQLKCQKKCLSKLITKIQQLKKISSNFQKITWKNQLQKVQEKQKVKSFFLMTENILFFYILLYLYFYIYFLIMLIVLLIIKLYFIIIIRQLRQMQFVIYKFQIQTISDFTDAAISAISPIIFPGTFNSAKAFAKYFTIKSQCFSYTPIPL